MYRSSLLSALAVFIVLSFICSVKSAPLEEHVPPKAKSAEKYITRSDVLLLKEKLAALEADLEQLEPAVPTEAVINDEEADDDIELDDGDEQDDEEEPVHEEVPDVADELAAEPNIEPAIENPEEVAEEEAAAEEDNEEEGDDEAWGPENDEEEEGEDVFVDELMPYRDPTEEDIYLRKLIVQALTVLYRKDAERINVMLQEYYNRLYEGDDFPQNAAPVPQDLSPNLVDLNEDLQPGAFVDRPYTDQEIQHENVLAAVASSKAKDKTALTDAELTLLSDIQTLEDQGVSLDQLVADLENEKEMGRQGRASAEEQVDDITKSEEEAEAMFGENEETDEQGAGDAPAQIPLEPHTDNEVANDVEDEQEEEQQHEVDDADDLLKELMSNLNSSLKKLEESKASSHDA